MGKEEQQLQLDEVRGRVASFCKSERGKRHANEDGWLSEESLRVELSRLDEMSFLLSRYGMPPIDSYLDLRPCLERAVKGGALEPFELLDIAFEDEAVSSLKAFMEEAGEPPLLLEFVRGILSFTSLRDEIRRCIDPSKIILDRASDGLRYVRNQLRATRRAIEEKLPKLIGEFREFLSSATLTEREGHYCLPVKLAYRSKVPGLILGRSGSGGTIFVEPSSLTSLNEKLADLLEMEKDEEAKVLRRLSSEVSSFAAAIEDANGKLGYFDFLLGKELFREDIKGHVAAISESGNLILPAARHPLLDKAKAVANSFSLSRQNRVYVISGPNAGGKTVALKTVGLLSLMFKLGYPLPTEQGAELPYFAHINVDIGDSQSIDDNLSTFSGHIRNIAKAIDGVGEDDLVLLDEVGTGTSPHEGEALAIAILKYLLSRGCYALISSHFEGVKAYALSTKGAKNASMEFDLETLSPTYRLLDGVPGESYGLLAATRYGLSDEIVDEAKRIDKQGQDSSVSASIRKLSETIEENDHLQKRLLQEKAELEQHLSESKRKESELNKRLRDFESELKKKEEDVIAKAKRRAEQAIKSLSAPGVKLHEAIKAKEELQRMQSPAEKPKALSDPKQFKEGDYVEVPDYALSGTITKIRGKKAEVSSAKGMSFTVELSSCLKSQPTKSEQESLKGAVVDVVGKSGLSLECNLIGLHYDEAKEELAHYLDACRVKNYKRVRIIHGLGSGALKRMTAEYCKNAKFVESIEPAGEAEGGAGATVVHLR